MRFVKSNLSYRSDGYESLKKNKQLSLQVAQRYCVQQSRGVLCAYQSPQLRSPTTRKHASREPWRVFQSNPITNPKISHTNSKIKATGRTI